MDEYMNKAEKLKEYEAEVKKLTDAIGVLKDARDDIWKKRDALFCKVG